MLNPKSEPEEIEKLPAEWEDALKIIFANNTPIVIGYGGNDGSLMGFLKNISPIKGGIFWCFHAGNEPDQKINGIVEYHHGRLVPILGFDEVMLQLWEKLQLPSPIPELQITHDKRKGEFQNQFEQLNKKLKQPTTANFAFFNWKESKDFDKAERLYRRAFELGLHESFHANNFAKFMEEARKNFPEANRLFRQALEFDPTDQEAIKEYARFLLEHPEFKK